MACAYKRGRFWWIKFRHHLTGELRFESTGLLVGSGRSKRLVLDMVAERTLLERRSRGVIAGEKWGAWVTPFLNERYASNAKSHARYNQAWHNLRMFLSDLNIPSPRFLTRQHCQSYPEWRKHPDLRRGKYRAGHNTALFEIKTLALIMKEAVLREYAPSNPCRELGLHRAPAKIKPALTPEEIDFIREKIIQEPEPTRTFLSVSFEIARYQGCRLSETYLNPQCDVDLENRRISFKAKGGRTHTTRLHESLVALFERLKLEGRTETYRAPKSPAKEWFNFFTRIGLKERNPNVCFHSTRVLVATELARANVTESKAMRYLGHASTTVHRSYQRLRPDDLDEAVDAVR